MSTKHTHGPNFGHRVADCPRCAELAAGAKAVPGWGDWKREAEQRQLDAIRAHFAGEYHRTGKCGPVCTFGEW